jgi:DNA invertase Pin-like site-specific DNA recombinase
MSTSPSSPRVIAYVRVSTEDQARSGLGLEAQRTTLEQEAARRGWADLEIVVDDGYSAKDLRRPGITGALAALAAGDAEVLVVAKLDRLSRSMLDFCELAERARKEGWRIIALDLGVDMTTPAGEMMAGVMALFAQYERRLIGQRTSAALQAKKSAGARLGRPKTMDEQLRSRVCDLYDEHRSLTAVANVLNDEGVATARGGARWYPSTVRGVLRTADLDRAAAI